MKKSFASPFPLKMTCFVLGLIVQVERHENRCKPYQDSYKNTFMALDIHYWALEFKLSSSSSIVRRFMTRKSVDFERQATLNKL